MMMNISLPLIRSQQRSLLLRKLFQQQQNSLSHHPIKPFQFHQRMSFHFGTKEYAACFRSLPTADPALLRAQTLEYLKSFDDKKWYNDPMVSLLKGAKLTGAQPVETVNALGVVNGKQILATSEQCAAIKDHIRSYQSPYKDLREVMRAIEHELLTNHAGELIGNQCLDFMKQDGMTEIEEAIMANEVERRLNDLLLQDEAAGTVVINRQPIYVSCVSNFTNFLDLCRKTIRSLEVGVPCIILGRTNTAQHPYRWTQLLVDMCAEKGVDPGMVTFLSCDLDSIKDITKSCQDFTGNLYTTCSRQLAADIMKTYPKVVASTGGPNTLVAMELNEAVQKAIQMSASIESSGQCTALRHCVVPSNTNNALLEGIFDTVKEIPDAPKAVEQAIFDGVFAKHAGTKPPSTPDYQRHKATDAHFKISDELPPSGINEYWRKVVVDFSKMDIQDKTNSNKLAAWLNENQPISLAVNGPRQQAIALILELFEKTGMVVNTVGSTDVPEMAPALTCQARPQEGEVFGEFPPRSELPKYTLFPVVVPSSNPSYDTTYSTEYLRSQAVGEYVSKSTKALLEEVKDPSVLGYCVVLIDYLKNVANANPKQGYGKNRTSLWGLQRPPLGTTTFVYCKNDTTWDDIAALYVTFHSTNARDQIELVLDPANSTLLAICDKHKIPHTVETEASMSARLADRKDVFNVVHASPKKNFPMVGNFVSLYFPLGHIKSTMAQDEEFLLKARISDKWLNTLF